MASFNTPSTYPINFTTLNSKKENIRKSIDSFFGSHPEYGHLECKVKKSDGTYGPYIVIDIRDKNDKKTIVLHGRRTEVSKSVAHLTIHRDKARRENMSSVHFIYDKDSETKRYEIVGQIIGKEMVELKLKDRPKPPTDSRIYLNILLNHLDKKIKLKGGGEYTLLIKNIYISNLNSYIDYNNYDESNNNKVSSKLNNTSKIDKPLNTIPNNFFNVNNNPKKTKILNNNKLNIDSLDKNDLNNLYIFNNLIKIFIENI